MENIEFSGGPNVLTESERAAFHDFEQAIESAESYALRMAWPLRSIRDERLYRETHPTFEKYVRERWDRTPQHVNRLIKAADVVDDLEKRGHTTIPHTERHSRPLGGLDARQRDHVVFTVRREGGFRKVPVSRVQEIADEVTGRVPKSRKGAELAASTPTDMVLVSKGGVVGPMSLSRTRILYYLEIMRRAADCIARLGPDAIPTAVASLDTTQQEQARNDIEAAFRVLGQFVDQFVKQYGTERPGQQTLDVGLW